MAGNRAWNALLVAALSVASLHGADKGQKILLVPKYHAGQSLRYLVDMHSQAQSQTMGPILNPQGARKLERTIRLVVRLDVLSAEGSGAGSMGRIRMRATYEEVDFASATDALDQGEQDLADKVKKLEGKSVEFTIEPSGEITGLMAPAELAPDPAAQEALRQGLAGLLPGNAAPVKSIGPGDKWTAEDPVKYAPLAGLYWKNDSTYERNEECGETAPGTECALLITQSRIIEKNKQGEQTPKEYLQNGLRSMGNWTGTGQSLAEVSLKSGLVTRLTQTGMQDLAFVVTSAATSSRIEYFGHVTSQTEIKLLGAEAGADADEGKAPAQKEAEKGAAAKP